MPTKSAEGYSKEVYLVDALPAGTNLIGTAGSPATVVTITPTLDTSAYTAGDVLFDTAAIAGAVRTSGGQAKLVSVVLVFFRSNVSLGTINGAPNISDANAREIIGHVAFASGDFVDVGGSKIGCLKNIGLLLQPTTGTTLYVAGICAGTPTQTASGIKIAFGFEQY
jgi:hypothetical protein